MTSQEINEAIADILGLDYGDKCVVCGKPRASSKHILYGPDVKNSAKHYFIKNRIPDFCHDLNAMAEAEKTLKNVRNTGAGALRLSVAVERYKSYLEELSDDPLFASAEQRAVAFLKTKGKYKG